MTKTFLLREIKPNTIQASIRAKLVQVQENPIFNPILKSEFKLLIFNDEQDEYRISFQLYPCLDNQEMFQNIHQMIGSLFLIDNVYAVVRDEHLEIRSEPFLVERVDEPIAPHGKCVDGSLLRKNGDVCAEAVGYALKRDIIDLSSAHYEQVFLGKDPLIIL